MESGKLEIEGKPVKVSPRPNACAPGQSPRTMVEFRCAGCGKLLAKYAASGQLLLQVFCRRCGSVVSLHIKGS